MIFSITNNQDTRYKQYSNSNFQFPNRFWLLIIWSLVIIWLLSLGDWLFAESISGNDLVENAKLYDGKTIEFQGEVIGDIMARGKHAWLNVNDGSRAIGIWTSKELTQKIKHIGGYRYLGDKIKVIGVFNRACSQHGGDLDIHATEISILERGEKIEHPVNPVKAALALILFVAALAAVFYPMILKARS